MMAIPATLLRRSEAGAVFALNLAPELEAFQGHFPGDPILPGVVMVDWAIRLAEEHCGPLGPFRGLAQIKFLAPVRPGDAVELSVEPAPGRLAFTYQCGSERKASGTVLLDARSGLCPDLAWGCGDRTHAFGQSEPREQAVPPQAKLAAQ